MSASHSVIRSVSVQVRLLLLILTILIVDHAGRSMTAVEKAGTIAGVVTKSSGEAAVGAFVKVRNAQRKLTFMVISQAGGRFQVTNLPEGKYQIQGIADGLQSEPPATTDLAAGQHATANLTLGSRQGNAAKAPTSNDYDRMAAWNSHLPKTSPGGDSTKYMVVEYALSTGANPHDVASDSKGVAWVSERVNGILGRFDPDSLTYTRIAVPPGDSGRFYLSAIAVDAEDRVWMIDAANARLVRYDPKAQAFGFFSIPEPDKGCGYCVRRPPHERFLFNAIRFHPDGSVWGTQIYGNQIVRLDPATKKTTAYPIPSHLKGLTKESGAHPYGMAIDGNQKIWFAENGGARVGKLDPSTGQITEYKCRSATHVRGEWRRTRRETSGSVWESETGRRAGSWPGLTIAPRRLPISTLLLRRPVPPRLTWIRSTI